MLKLRHPLWTHVVAVGLGVWMISALWGAWPLPARVPMQFGWAGEPVRWGSRWELVGVLVVVPLLLIGLGLFFDENWARGETRRRFNYIALFDEVLLGFLAPLCVAHLSMIQRGGEMRLAMPWGMMLAAVAGAGLLAAAIERGRPWRAPERRVDAEDTSLLTSQIEERARAGERWVYWETQNPVWVTALSLLFAVEMLLVAVVMWVLTPTGMPWLTPVFAVLAAVMIVPCGGLRVSVNRREVEVRLGLLGLRLLKLRLADVDAVDLESFSPLADFGGWGIRCKKGTWAFFFTGNRGVMLRTRAGRRFVIGSDHPERLAAAISVARRDGDPSA
jgi:hypothetical protein